MKSLATVFGIFLSGPAAWAATNIIYVGHGNSAATPVFSGQSVPWLANLIPLGILLVGLGHLLYPRVAWWFKYGWKYEDPMEPSALWLFFERVGGALIILLALGIFAVMHGMVSKFLK